MLCLGLAVALPGLMVSMPILGSIKCCNTDNVDFDSVGASMCANLQFEACNTVQSVIQGKICMSGGWCLNYQDTMMVAALWPIILAFGLICLALGIALVSQRSP